MTAPNYQDAGTSDAQLTATNCSPTTGTHVAGDWLICVVANASEAPNTPAGWTVGPTYTGNGQRISIYYKLAAGAGTAAPTFNFTTNHVYARVFVIRNAHQTYPFALLGVGQSTAANTVGHTAGGATLVDDCLIFMIAAWGVDSAGPLASTESNSSVAALTERSDEGTALGTGSGVVVYTGDKAAAGTVDPSAFTWGSSTTYTTMTIAFNPIADKVIAGTVTIDGVAAANGNDVRALDVTQPAASYLCTVAVTTGGTGAFSISAPYTAHSYQAVYEDGASYGASSVAVAV